MSVNQYGFKVWATCTLLHDQITHCVLLSYICYKNMVMEIDIFLYTQYTKKPLDPTMKKTVLLLLLLFLLSSLTENAPAFEGGNQTLVCYFHNVVYDIQFINAQQAPNVQCGLPDQQLVNDTPEHDIHKRLDIHDPECFTWVYQ